MTSASVRTRPTSSVPMTPTMAARIDISANAPVSFLPMVQLRNMPLITPSPSLPTPTKRLTQQAFDFENQPDPAVAEDRRAGHPGQFPQGAAERLDHRLVLTEQ